MNQGREMSSGGAAGSPGSDHGEQADRAQQDREHELTVRLGTLQDAKEVLQNETVKGHSGGRHGGVFTVAEAQREMHELKKKIKASKQDGCKKHKEVSAQFLWVVLLILLGDFVILALFLSEVFNVRLDALQETPLRSIVTLVFTTIITVGLALALRWIAIRRRPNKDDQGKYRAPDGARSLVSRLEIPLLVVLLAGIAAVMLVRVLSDARNSGVEAGTAWVIAVFLAFITATLNGIIYWIEFADGSDESHERDGWGKTLLPFLKRQQELDRQIKATERQLQLARRPSPSEGTQRTAPPTSNGSGPLPAKSVLDELDIG